MSMFDACEDAEELTIIANSIMTRCNYLMDALYGIQEHCSIDTMPEGEELKIVNVFEDIRELLLPATDNVSKCIALTDELIGDLGLDVEYGM